MNGGRGKWLRSASIKKADGRDGIRNDGRGRNERIGA